MRGLNSKPRYGSKGGGILALNSVFGLLFSHPTAEWTAQQVRHAFPRDTTPRAEQSVERISAARFTTHVQGLSGKIQQSPLSPPLSRVPCRSRVGPLPPVGGVGGGGCNFRGCYLLSLRRFDPLFMASLDSSIQGRLPAEPELSYVTYDSSHASRWKP